MTTSILMPLAQELPTSHVFDASLWLARGLKAHVQAAYIRPDPDAAASMIPEMIAAAGVTRDAIEREGRQAASAAEARFAEWRDRNGGFVKPSDDKRACWSASWCEHVGEFEPIVTRFGRLSDFIILPRPAADEVVAQRCFDAAVFGTGRPSLLVGDTLPAKLTDNISSSRVKLQRLPSCSSATNSSSWLDWATETLPACGWPKNSLEAPMPNCLNISSSIRSAIEGRMIGAGRHRN